VPIVSDIRPSDHGEIDLSDVRSSLRSAMWRNVVIERMGAKLGDVSDMFDFWARYTLDKIFDDPAGWETQNMLLVGALMARSAAWRQESRGCHARSEFPEARESFMVHDCWRRGRSDALVVRVKS
jgi:L-aspartate oxidase